VQKFHKYLKLTNGDDIIVTTDSNCENFRKDSVLYVYDPVLISTVRLAQGHYFVETFTMQPWIKLAKDDIMEIPTENVIIAVDIDDKVVTQYEMFLNEYSNSAPDFDQMSEDRVDDFFDAIESDEFDEFDRDTEEEGPTFH
jgi:hypothetical protein